MNIDEEVIRMREANAVLKAKNQQYRTQITHNVRRICQLNKRVKLMNAAHKALMIERDGLLANQRTPNLYTEGN